MPLLMRTKCRPIGISPLLTIAYIEQLLLLPKDQIDE